MKCFKFGNEILPNCYNKLLYSVLALHEKVFGGTEL